MESEKQILKCKAIFYLEIKKHFQNATYHLDYIIRLLE